jgi:hypothetical protein
MPPVHLLPGVSNLGIDVFNITSTYEIDGNTPFIENVASLISKISVICPPSNSG